MRAVTNPDDNYTGWAHCYQLGLTETLAGWPAGTVALHPGWAWTGHGKTDWTRARTLKPAGHGLCGLLGP